MKKIALSLAFGWLLAGCQTDADIRPASYDELALATGHWEWESTGYQSGNHTPATEGYTRQLVFGAGGQLTVRRNGRSDYQTSYQLSMGPLPACGQPTHNVPLITFASDKLLPNNDLKTYSVGQAQGQQTLSLAGAAACVDGGAYETYHWVAE